MTVTEESFINQTNRVKAEAIKRFNAWVENPDSSAIPPSLRGAVWRAGLDDNAARNVEVLKKEWFSTKAIDGKLIALGALATVDDADLVKNNLIPFNFNSSPPQNAVPAADMHVLGGGLAAHPVGRAIQWEFMKSNWDLVVAKLGNPIVVDRFVGLSLKTFTDDAILSEIEEFFKDKDTHSFDRTLETAKDRIRGRSAYKSRDSAALKQWLSSNGYF
jgi:hypothetical protein